MGISEIKKLFVNKLVLFELVQWIRRNLRFSFFPYYLTEEGLEPVVFTENDPAKYEVCVLTIADLESTSSQNPSLNLERWQEIMEQGHICVALRKSGKLAAYCWANPIDFPFRPQSSPLGPRDVYLYNAFTIEDFRGKGLAPFMRKHCYKVLRSLGYQRFFSITEYFNNSSVGFKRKLNARFVSCNLRLSFREREICHFVLSRNTNTRI